VACTPRKGEPYCFIILSEAPFITSTPFRLMFCSSAHCTNLSSKASSERENQAHEQEHKKEQTNHEHSAFFAAVSCVLDSLSANV
jgi:hypothetical protein